MHIKQIILLSLIIAFIVYSAMVYTIGTSSKNSTTSFASEREKGKMLWQKYNCSSCHQIYGLGGYLGPDLTNIISNKAKGSLYAKTIIMYGSGRMPNFRLSEEQAQALVDYLKCIDTSALSDSSLIN